MNKSASEKCKHNSKRAEVLFLGNTGTYHDSGKYAPWLAIALFKRGINLTYTTDLNDLNKTNLTKYDGLVIYANYDSITVTQERALKSFVESGKGLIPLHAASDCFKNSKWYIKTIGAQSLSHETGSFTTKILNQPHPITQNVSAFKTTDGIYFHQKINPDISVLTERVDGAKSYPYTWIRKQGKGRVFYTAYGHDDSTWKKADFLKLVTNGILWALGDRVKDQIDRLKIPDVGIYPDTISNFTARHLVTDIQKALTPEESIKLMQVPADFEIKLFAAEPDITNPIAMSWDEKGRLWIIESVDYPNTLIETDGAANDRIKICEDTNGDGRADKFTVFADSLNIPTSLVFANGGIIVAMAPNFVFMKDTNGDDKADIRQNIITGFGKYDTHAGPSNLQYGFDNKIWGVLGYSAFNGTVNGQNIRFDQGIYRFNSDGTNLEYMAPTSNNTWGLGVTEDNNTFISTANNTHSGYYSMPFKYVQRSLPGNNIKSVQKLDGHYEAHSMTPNLRQVDVVGGFTAAAGHHFYTARSFPREYWNRIAFVCEPTARLIHNAILKPAGAGFTESDGWNFLASSDEWVSPVQAEVGPDGAVWIADWYNFVIQHSTFTTSQAPTEVILPLSASDQIKGKGNALITKLRDIDHGRIYRVLYKKARPYLPISLSKNDIPGLISALKSDNMFWRLTAQRLLVESKNLSVLPALYKIIDNKEVDEIGLNGAAIHALWTLQGLNALNGSNSEALQVVKAAFSHPAAGVRKAAVDVLPDSRQAIEIIRNSGLIKDGDLNVRKSVLTAIAATPPSVTLGKFLYDASLDTEIEKDPWLTNALFAASTIHREGFLASSAAVPSGTTRSALSRRIASQVSPEIYPLNRSLEPISSPDLTEKEFFISASLSIVGIRDLRGVIVAQGGKDDGFCLYLQDNKLTFLIKQNSKTYTAVTAVPVHEKFDILASFTQGGIMSIEVNNKKMASNKTGSLFNKSLVPGIRIAQDIEGINKIGEYKGSSPLTGDMQNAQMELKDSKKTKPLSNLPNDVQSAKSKIIVIKVVKDLMQYDKKLFMVRAGETITIDFQNPDGMQHNLLIIKPGTLQKVGAAADEMLRDPKAAEKNYIPEIPEILQAINLLDPQQSFQLTFTVPDKPGDYPFVCTFPGHWRGMNGIMRVIK